MYIQQPFWGIPLVPDLLPLVVTCQSTRSPAWGEYQKPILLFIPFFLKNKVNILMFIIIGIVYKCYYHSFPNV